MFCHVHSTEVRSTASMIGNGKIAFPVCSMCSSTIMAGKHLHEPALRLLLLLRREVAVGQRLRSLVEFHLPGRPRGQLPSLGVWNYDGVVDSSY